MDTENHRLPLESVEESRRSIDPVFLRSPQFGCEPLGDLLGVRMVLKVEDIYRNGVRAYHPDP